MSMYLRTANGNYTSAAIGAAVEVSERTFRYRVLLVDDDANLRGLSKSILESQGYEVHCAQDGLEALAALQKAQSDVIISDLKMPSTKDFGFLSVVRQGFPALPVIVISDEFSRDSVSGAGFADAIFARGSYQLAALFGKLIELLTDLPRQPCSSYPKRDAVWAKNGRDLAAATYSPRRRTFTVARAVTGTNVADADFCASLIKFESVLSQNAAWLHDPPLGQQALRPAH